jgi:signal transduction histidine kinase
MEKSGEDEVLAITRDITERKRAERELRRSRARIVEAEASERRRLERNLHDGAQSRLVALSLALRLAQSQLAANPESAGETLSAASSELALALEELRDLARGLHPAILADRGLGPALDALAERAPLPVEVRVGPEGRLPEPVDVAAYYIVSEALANVAKDAHAQASHTTVEVQRRDQELVVEVVDDRVGGADPSGGDGLRGLADRVEALDGRLSVESAPGSGTRVAAVIPLA